MLNKGFSVFIYVPEFTAHIERESSCQQTHITGKKTLVIGGLIAKENFKWQSIIFSFNSGIWLSQFRLIWDI